MIVYGYVANGNVTAITPPSKPPYGFAFDLVDLPSDYVPPVATGSGSTRTRYFYNPDRQPTQILRPDGQTIDFGYDSAGRLSAITTLGIPPAALYFSVSRSKNQIVEPEGNRHRLNGPAVQTSLSTADEILAWHEAGSSAGFCWSASSKLGCVRKDTSWRNNQNHGPIHSLR